MKMPTRGTTALLALLIVGGVLALGYGQRQRLYWSVTDASPAPVELGALTLDVPAALPARLVFDDGDLRFFAGAAGFDPFALEVVVTPIAEEMDEDSARAALAPLELALRGEHPGARVAVETVDGHATLRARMGAEDEASWRGRVALTGAALVQVEATLAPSAPDKWRAAARRAISPAWADGASDAEKLRRFIDDAAVAECPRGSPGACHHAARRAFDAGHGEGAATLAEVGLRGTSDPRVLWEVAQGQLLEEAKRAVLHGGDEAFAAVREQRLQAWREGRSEPPLAELVSVVDLWTLLGDARRAAGDGTGAASAWERVWPLPVGAPAAERTLAWLADEVRSGARPADEGIALAEKVRDAHGGDARVLIAFAHVSAAAKRFNEAELAVRAAVAGDASPAIMRSAVSVPIVPAPEREPLECPRGTRLEEKQTSQGTSESACRDAAGLRHGPAQQWWTRSGYLLRAATYKRGDLDAPTRDYWENGRLQMELFRDDDGNLLRRRWDPFGELVEDAAPDSAPLPSIPGVELKP
jgi:hypothetical protein